MRYIADENIGFQAEKKNTRFLPKEMKIPAKI